MTLPREITESPVYKEALSLMENRKIEAIQQWEEQKKKASETDYQPYVSEGMYNTYLACLHQYADKLQSSYPNYQAASTPLKKEAILKSLTTRDRKNLANSIKQMDELRKEKKAAIARSTPAPSSSNASPETKKSSSGFWKGVGISALVVGTTLAGWFGHKAASSDKKPEITGNKSSIVQTLQKSSDRVLSPQDVAFQQAVKQQVQKNTISAYQANGTAIQAQQYRDLADISASKRTINYNTVGQAVDDARAGAAISRAVRETAENTTITVKEGTKTVHGVRGFFNAFHHHGGNGNGH